MGSARGRERGKRREWQQYVLNKRITRRDPWRISKNRQAFNGPKVLCMLMYIDPISKGRLLRTGVGVCAWVCRRSHIKHTKISMDFNSEWKIISVTSSFRTNVVFDGAAAVSRATHKPHSLSLSLDMSDARCHISSITKATPKTSKK